MAAKSGPQGTGLEIHATEKPFIGMVYCSPILEKTRSALVNEYHAPGPIYINDYAPDTTARFHRI